MRAVPPKTLSLALRLVPAAVRLASPLLLLGAGVALTACKPPPLNCKPEDHGFEKIRVVVQADPQINLDAEGTPRSSSLRVYQLKGGRSLDIPLDFRDLWQKAGEVFGDELLAEKEFTVYPDKVDVFELDPVPEATHVVAAVIFREPVGSAWYAEWEVPLYHGDSWCAAQAKEDAKKKRKKKDPPPDVKLEDPCFLLYVEGSQVAGGHEPPPGMDPKLIPIECPPAPLKVKPAPPAEGKKKKKKGKLKDKAGDAQEKGADAQEKGAAAQDANDKAQGVGDAASDPPVPGKD